VQVGDVGRAREFYGELFGGAPQFEPHEDFLEWRVGEQGETWFQVVGVPGDVQPLATRLRFRVEDLLAARSAVLGSGVDASPVTALPGVVRWFDFADPWGNRLGYFEDLAPTGAQPGPGGSVHDPAHFSAG
jgi:predicted enzyme related to lactoylglutathione lyase